jgi:hypothetical protein
VRDIDPGDPGAASEPCPAQVAEYAGHAVAYVQRALDFTLEFDSETLPVLDHYLRTVPHDSPAAARLIAATCGAYFGEVLRRELGGYWDLASGDPCEFRLVLPGGLTVVPAGLTLAAIERSDAVDLDCQLHPPLRLRSLVAQIVAQMGDVSEETYYSLCGRLDSLAHIVEAVLARQALPS